VTLFIDRAFGCRSRNNTVFAGWYGINIYDRSSSNAVVDNTVTTTRDDGYGIPLQYLANNNTVSGNTVVTSGVSSYGFYVSESANNTLVNNKANTSSSVGYFIDGADFAAYNQTIGMTNLAEGLPVLYNFSLSNAVYQNRDWTGTYGQVICGWCANVTYDRINMSSDGIGLLNCSNSKITSSNIATTSGYGAYVFGGGADTVFGNRISTSAGQSLYAIVIYGSPAANVSSNRVNTSGSHGDGIYVGSSGHGVFLGNNLTVSGTSNGIYINSASQISGNMFSDNWISAPSASGNGIVMVSNMDNTSFSGTRIDTAGQGMYLNVQVINFTMADSVVNSTLEALYLESGTSGGEWNFTNVTKAAAAGIDVLWQPTASGRLNVNWYLDVYANYTNGSVAQGVNVSVHNRLGQWQFNASTGSNGYVGRRALLEYMQNSSSTKTYYSNYAVNASLRASTQSNTTNMSTNRMLVFTFPISSCEPIPGRDWVVDASENCYILGKSYVVGNISFVNTGTLTVENSNITADGYSQKDGVNVYWKSPFMFARRAG
jgi:parallel beta-helix repeat protein